MGRREMLNKVITNFPGRTVGDFRMLFRKGYNFKNLWIADFWNIILNIFRS